MSLNEGKFSLCLIKKHAVKKYGEKCISTQKYTETGAAESSEKLVYQYQTTRHHSPENSYILSHVH
jgi:hypothetical protein